MPARHRNVPNRKSASVRGKTKPCSEKSSGSSSSTESPYFGEGPGGIDLVRRGHASLQRGGIRPRKRIQRGTARIEREEAKGREQKPAGPQEQKWQRDQSGEGVLREDVAIPDQQQVDEAEDQKHGQAAGKPVERLADRAKPVELDCQADTEQQRKERERLFLEPDANDALDETVRRASELLKYRNPESRDQVDDEHAE